ncbi:nucleoside deaminase [Methylopila musalis]|uniref:Nucleoside deaminase n=1 Tax=Methylopila musalis TaxID=1134781 RepID=A0ABW3Z8Q0_9HYPH
MTERELLLRAAELSRVHSLAGDGAPFGAVVATPDGTVVAEGWNETFVANDPTAHAEVVAIRRATQALGRLDLSGHVIYASCEPCPMCLGAIFWARLDRVVFANSREDAARFGFDDAALYDEVARPLDARRIRCEHAPLDEALDVFGEWARWGGPAG